MKNKRLIKISKIIIAIVTLYSLLGFILLPYLIQSNFTKILKQTTSATGYVEKVYINPYTFEFNIKNLLILDDKNKTLLHLGKFSFDFEFTNLFKSIFIIKNISTENLKLNLSLNKQKNSNFQYILDFISKNKTVDKQPKSKDSKIPNIKIETINFINNKISFVDNSKTIVYKLVTKEFNINIKNISTQKDSVGDIKTKIIVEDTLNLELDSKISINPLDIDGSISIKKLRIDRINSYLKDSIGDKFGGKDLNLDLNYHLLRYENKIKYDLTDIKVFLNQFIYFDNTQEKRVNLEIDDLKIDIPKITSDLKKVIKYNIKFNLPKDGNVSLVGDIIPATVDLNTTIYLNNISFDPYTVYLKRFLNLDLKKGLLNSKLNIHLSKVKNEFLPKIDGDLFLDDIDIWHSLKNKRLISFDQLSLKGIKFTTDNLNIDNIILNKFYTKFIISKKRTTNFDNILVKTKSKKEVKKNKSKNKFNYKIGSIILKDSKTDFSDFSLPLQFSTKIHTLEANIKNISSNDKITNVKLTGVIDKYGMATISGDINPSNFKKKTDIKIDFENLDVTSFSPYSGKFIGNKISKGKLWLDLTYHIRDSKLTSSNNMRLKDLTLGEPVESKDAINLPIGFVIALLEDSDGFIDVDVPVEGDIDNPEFKLGGAIWGAIGNVIKNIISSPFRFLGSILGIDSDELGSLTFEYGAYEIVPSQKEKLDNLIKVLKKKSNLVLSINPVYDKKNDKYILQKQKWEKLIFKKDRDKFIISYFIKKFGKKEYQNIQKKNKSKDIISTLESKLILTIEIKQKDFEYLATQRVNNIKKYLLENGLSQNKVKIIQNIINKDFSDTKNIILTLDVNIKK